MKELTIQFALEELNKIRRRAEVVPMNSKEIQLAIALLGFIQAARADDVKRNQHIPNPD